MENNKEKRISFLSILSSLCSSDKFGNVDSLTKEAYKITDELFSTYPLEEENETKREETNEKCEICGDKIVIMSGQKRGRNWKGKFCDNPECSRKPEWLKTDQQPVEENKYIKI